MSFGWLRSSIPAAILGAVLALWLAGKHWGAKVANLEAAHAQAQAAALQRVRDVEASWAEAVARIEKEAKREVEALEAAVADAAVERDGLRAALADHRRRTAARSPAACDCSAAGSAADLYAELLGEVADLAGGIAIEADRRRIAGLACERAYDAIQGGGEE